MTGHLLFRTAFVVLSATLFAAGLQAQPYTLTNQYHDGQQAYMKLTIYQQGSIQAGAANNPVEATSESVIGYTTVKAGEPASLKVKLESMTAVIPTLGIREPVDMMKILNPDDASFEISINQQGEVVESDKPVALSTSLPGNVSQSPIQMRPYPRLPKGEVNPGHVWHESWVMPFTGASKPVIAHATYTLDKVEQQDGVETAVISSDTLIDAKDVDFEPMNSSGTGIAFKMHYAEMNIAGKGVILFDMTNGHVKSYEDDMKIRQVMSAQSQLGDSSFDNEQSISVRTRTRAEYHSDNPNGGNQ
ncbi:MAG: hypothetical protein GC154_18380 [bacterium]|nr:hypothetical protein [bacterium]